MGAGTALGAAVGSERPTLLVTGDGGLMLGGLSELQTAVRWGLDLLVVVLNDAAYGAEHIQMRNRDLDPALTTFQWPNFADVARSLGGEGAVATSLEELNEALDRFAVGSGVRLIEVRLDPDRISMTH